MGPVPGCFYGAAQGMSHAGDEQKAAFDARSAPCNEVETRRDQARKRARDARNTAHDEVLPLQAARNQLSGGKRASAVFQRMPHMEHASWNGSFTPSSIHRRQPYVTNLQSKAPVAPRDEELVARVKRGDRRAFRLLVERHQDAVARTVTGMLGPTQEVDDVVQEAFIRLYQSLDRFRHDAAIGTYLRRIAINRALDALRRRKRILGRFISRDDEAQSMPDASVDESLRLETKERGQIVWQAIGKLSPNHRAVVILRLIEGHSTEETAEILSTAYGTVLSRLSRATARLREILGPLLEEQTNA